MSNYNQGYPYGYHQGYYYPGYPINQMQKTENDCGLTEVLATYRGGDSMVDFSEPKNTQSRSNIKKLTIKFMAFFFVFTLIISCLFLLRFRDGAAVESPVISTTRFIPAPPLPLSSALPAPEIDLKIVYSCDEDDGEVFIENFKF